MKVAKKPLLMLVMSQQETLDRIITIFRAREPVVDVIGVESSEKALDFALHHPISALAADEHMGDMSGAELVTKIKGLRPELTAMIMLSPGNVRLREVSRSTGLAECVDKTANIEHMVSQISSHLFEREVGFRGLLDNLELPDILQLLCLRQESKEVRITSGSRAGTVLVEKGQVVHARTPSLQGETAFYDLFCWKGGAFQLKPLGSDIKHTIERPWESLLMEAGRLLDEQGEQPEGGLPSRESVGPSVSTETTSTEKAKEAAADTEKTEPEAGTDAEEKTDLMPGVVVVGTKSEESARVDVYDIHSGKHKELTARHADKNTPWPEEELQKCEEPKPRRRASHAKTPPAALTVSRKPGEGSAKRAKASKKRPTTKIRTKKAKPQARVQTTRRSRRLVRHQRSTKGRSLRRVAAGAFTVTMAVPIVAVVVLSVPWLMEQPSIVAHVRAVMPENLLSTKLAKNTTPVPVVEAPTPMPSDWGYEPGICEVRIAPLKEFSKSANVVALDGETFDALKLADDQWVELTTPSGLRMGATAIRKKTDSGVIYIRRTMALALDLKPGQKTYVKVRPVELVYDLDEEGELAFSATRLLAEPYCESWYAVGIGLSVMKTENLTPGSYAIVKGPRGYQSAQIQVMDRGNPDEIWLSSRVRDAIGIENPTDDVILYPRNPLEPEPKKTEEDQAGELVSR